MLIWDWLKQPEIAGAIGAIAGVAGVFWAIYTYFSKRGQSKSKSKEITASGGSIVAEGNISAKAKSGGTAIVTTGDVNIDAAEIAKQLVEYYDKAHKRELDDSRQQIQDWKVQITKLVTDALAALPKQTDIPNAKARIKEASEQAAQGNTALAEAIFLEVEERKVLEGEAANKEAAEAARQRGALAFLHDTQKALNAYRRATQLDPDNVKGWNQLGRLLKRTGELNEAETSYQRVLALGEKRNNRSWIAAAYGNLGNVYHTRREPGTGRGDVPKKSCTP